MREPTPLFFPFWELPATPTARHFALGLLLAALMAMASFRKAFGAAEDGLRFVGALPLGFVGARLGYLRGQSQLYRGGLRSRLPLPLRTGRLFHGRARLWGAGRRRAV